MPAPVSIGGFFISAGNATDTVTAGADTVALCLSLSGAKVTKRFENTKIYVKKVVSFGKRRRDDGSVALLQIVSFRAHFVTIIIGRREKWGAEVKA